MPSDQSQGDSGGSSVSISGSSRRKLSALCGSAVNGGAKRLTAETQRTLSWRREFRIKTLLRRRHTKTRIESRSEEHTSELQSHSDLVCRLLLEKKNKT